MTSERVRQALKEFVRERNWAKFHTPANLAKSSSIEAGELLECFQWNDHADPPRVSEELADVPTYCMLLAEQLSVDPDEIVLAKLVVTADKYPAERAKGRTTKYDAP
ncbi:nucleotide pyrophosphohydrolase [Microbacterium invictum]|uniref:Nucleotide pyrophosphohydrolase n=1 Tax=Microbacterium invictum TaxID=515415 RepID=A0ABZ0VDA3_9MICO|nr:nucleotide pyrophosphohydrolase [Microbacterium invictum]WQB71606.1 nucleotide pyrophosphohydrolase [Microbacterium invictum]